MLCRRPLNPRALKGAATQFHSTRRAPSTTPMPTPLDAYDLKLLALVQQDARLPQGELGRQVHLSAAAVNRRLKRMADEGVIERHATIVNPDAVGCELTVIVEVEVESERADLLDAMMQGPKPLDLKLTDPNGFSLLALARCYSAEHAAAWLREHGAAQPDQGYAACREAMKERKSKGGA